MTRPVVEPVGKVSLELTSPPGAMTDEQASRLRSLLTSALARSRFEQTSVGDPGATALQGVVVEYTPGNRALRYFFGGFGVGIGRFRSNWLVKNAAGAEIGECSIDGSIHAGWFGGSYNELLDRVGGLLEQCLRGKK